MHGKPGNACAMIDAFTLSGISFGIAIPGHNRNGTELRLFLTLYLFYSPPAIDKTIADYSFWSYWDIGRNRLKFNRFK